MNRLRNYLFIWLRRKKLKPLIRFKLLNVSKMARFRYCFWVQNMTNKQKHFCDNKLFLEHFTSQRHLLTSQKLINMFFDTPHTCITSQQLLFNKIWHNLIENNITVLLKTIFRCPCWRFAKRTFCCSFSCCDLNHKLLSEIFS